MLDPTTSGPRDHPPGSARATIPGLTWLLAVIVLGAAAVIAPHARVSERPPNIVLIMADDLGIGELGCYGQRVIRTPSIDRLAREGMRFTQHYSGAPVCAPARCILLTGRHSGHAIVRDNWERGGWGPDQPEGQYPLPAGTPTIATALRSAGYATAAIGKWGLGGPETSGMPDRQGFDLFYGYLCQRVAHNLYPTHLWRNGQREDLPGNTWGNLVGETYAHDRMAEEMLAFVEANRDRPFFLYLPFHIPHLALQVPEDSMAPYHGAFPDPPYDGSRGYLPHPTPRAAYAGMVTRMDRDIGRLLELLASLDLERDTIVLFTSDNGPTFDIGGADSDFFASTGGRRGRKGSVYEGGLRVPLVARWPGRIAAGTTTTLPSAFEDLMPTLCALAGTATPATTDGVSLVPTLVERGTQAVRPHLYWEFPGYGGQQAVRLGDWKGVRRNMRGGQMAIQLYDLATDPGETTDVADRHPDVVARLREIMATDRTPSEAFPLWGFDRPPRTASADGRSG